MKTKVHYLVEWYSVWPEGWRQDSPVTGEVAGEFTNRAKAMKKVKSLTKVFGHKTRLSKITTDVMIFKPKA